MAGCCPSRDYHRFFNQRFARRLANRYRKHGLDKTAQKMVEFLRELGIEGHRPGDRRRRREIEIELLQAGAAQAQNLELSPPTSTRRTSSPGRPASKGASTGASTISPRTPGRWRRPTWWSCTGWCAATHITSACWELPPTMRGAPWWSAIHPATPSRAPSIEVFNLVMRLTRSSFRGFAHPPDAMVGVLEDHGLRGTYRHRGRIWQVAGLERVS